MMSINSCDICKYVIHDMIIMMVRIDYDEKMLRLLMNDDDADFHSSPVLKNLHLRDNSSWPSDDKDVKFFLENYMLYILDDLDDNYCYDSDDVFRGGHLTSRLSLKELNDRLEKYIGSMEMLPQSPHHTITRWTWW